MYNYVDARLFFQTVHSVNARDYTKEQFLDRLFVHKNHQHKGIATAICDELESFKAFFEEHGYRVKKEQTLVRNGISLTNFVMEK